MQCGTKGFRTCCRLTQNLNLYKLQIYIQWEVVTMNELQLSIVTLWPSLWFIASVFIVKLCESHYVLFLSLIRIYFIYCEANNKANNANCLLLVIKTQQSASLTGSTVWPTAVVGQLLVSPTHCSVLTLPTLRSIAQCTVFSIVYVYTHILPATCPSVFSQSGLDPQESVNQIFWQHSLACTTPAL